MTDTADLRRLAEQANRIDDGWWWGTHSLRERLDSPTADIDAAYIAAANPQAILALLDNRGNKWIEIANDWHRNAIAAERRVAALEKLVDEAENLIRSYVPDGSKLRAEWLEARALLAAAPSRWTAEEEAEYQDHVAEARRAAGLPAEVGDRFDVVDADDGHLAIRVSEATDE